MKVFISHKQEDHRIASAIAERLVSRHRIQIYLDTIDPDTSKAGDDLGEYIRQRLSECTDLMAVVSEKTKMSWWVPWEIGVATEKVYPISTFAGGNCALPVYLRKWPYLRSLDDVDTYVTVRRRVDVERMQDRAAGRTLYKSFANQFHQRLRVSLGQ